MKNLLWVVILLVLLFALLGLMTRQRYDRVTVIRDTVIDTFIERDTAPSAATPPRETGETITVYVPVTQLSHHRLYHPDTMCRPDDPESVAVDLPVEQVVYRDSLYEAYVSGVRPRLDSIFLKIPRQTVTVTKTIRKSPRLSLGVTVGPGYDFIHKQPTVGVTVGLSYRLSK